MSEKLKRNLIDLIIVAAVFAAFLGLSGLMFKACDPLILSDYNTKMAEERAALVGGGELTELKDVQLVDGVSEVYSTADGHVLCTVSSQGFESEIKLSIAVAADGTVSNIAVVSQNETPEKGGMALSGDYMNNYIGLSSADGVDAYSGASYTSEAIKDCVNKAIMQFKAVNGIDFEAPVSQSNDELIAQALTAALGEKYEALDVELVEKVTAVYASETGYACLVEGMGYDNDTTDAVGPSPIILLVCFDKDALVTEISVIEQHETQGYGANAFNEYYLNMYDGYGEFVFKYQIPGMNAQVIDSQSNATGTSQSVYYLVKAATEQMKLVLAAQ